MWTGSRTIVRPARLAVVTAALSAAACPAGSVPAAPPNAASATLPVGRLVDLSHPYDANAVFWPTADPFRLEKVADGVTPGGYYYAANNFFSSEHGGTHLDAPIHFAQGRQTVDQVPLERLLGPAAVVDVAASAARDPDYLITVADLEAFERAHGRLEPDVILLFRTGFASRWPDAVRYLGTAERGDAGAAKLHFPGLHPDAARWLVSSRPVKAVGIDTASIDYGQSKGFDAHRALYERDIPAFENLASLDALPARGAYVIALPMKIAGGSGAPLRAVAVVPSASTRVFGVSRSGAVGSSPSRSSRRTGPEQSLRRVVGSRSACSDGSLHCQGESAASTSGTVADFPGRRQARASRSSTHTTHRLWD